MIQLRAALTGSLFLYGIALVSACDELDCPRGYQKDGKLCLRPDASMASAVSDSAVTVDEWQDDASSSSLVDSGALDASGADSEMAPSPDASSNADTGMLDVDAAIVPDAASMENDGSVNPPPECSDSRPCSPGYTCTSGTCTSACAQTRCDPNATCALKDGGAVCTCNSGYISQGTGANVSCVRDVACSELGCDANASCEVGADQLRRCACKIGYTGSGTSCQPVTCPALKIDNGTVSGGSSYQQTATYACNTGYEFASGVGTVSRTCGADMSWSGSSPRCDPVSCGVPPNVLNATVMPTSAGTYQATARYTCNAGFELGGAATITCGPKGQWSTAPTCKSLCGNGRIDIGEQCEREAPSDKWRCSSDCKRLTIYTGCWSDVLCDESKGEVCHNSICTKPCTDSSSCPATPTGTTPHCWATWQVCVAAGCTSSDDCHPGLVCLDGMCYGCPGHFPGACGPNANVECLDAKRQLASLGTFGQCGGWVPP